MAFQYNGVMQDLRHDCSMNDSNSVAGGAKMFIDMYIHIHISIYKNKEHLDS